MLFRSSALRPGIFGIFGNLRLRFRRKQWNVGRQVPECSVVDVVHDGIGAVVGAAGGQQLDQREALEGSAAAGHEACDQPIRSLEILNQCVPLFETLKDPNRQQLLVQLVCHGPQTVGELAESSALSRTAVSHHIKLLEQAGFIEISKDATRRICSVRADRWLPLLDELSSALKADLAAAEQCRA